MRTPLNASRIIGWVCVAHCPHFQIPCSAFGEDSFLHCRHSFHYGLNFKLIRITKYVQIVLIEEYNATTLNLDECCLQNLFDEKITTITTTEKSSFVHSSLFAHSLARSYACSVHIFRLLLFKYHLNDEHVCAYSCSVQVCTHTSKHTNTNIMQIAHGKRTNLVVFQTSTWAKRSKMSNALVCSNTVYRCCCFYFIILCTPKCSYKNNIGNDSSSSSSSRCRRNNNHDDDHFTCDLWQYMPTYRQYICACDTSLFFFFSFVITLYF